MWGDARHHGERKDERKKEESEVIRQMEGRTDGQEKRKKGRKKFLPYFFISFVLRKIFFFCSDESERYFPSFPPLLFQVSSQFRCP